MFTVDSTCAESLEVRQQRRAQRFRHAPAVVASTAFLLYATLAVRLHQLFETRGYDLGILGQYAKAFADLAAPTSAYRAKYSDLSQSGPNLFGDHVSPVLAVLGPLYRLFPHIEVLLVLQAALVAASVFVVTRFAVRRLGGKTGVALGTAYTLSWGIQQLVGFDFHEVAFELPLISLAIVAYLEGRARTAALWAAGLLLAKEDMGLTLFVLGLLMRREHPRVARALCVLGPIAMALALFVVIPHFTSTGSLGRFSDPTPAGSGFGVLLTHPWRIPLDLLWPPVKLATVLMILVPTGFFAARSRVILLAVPTLLWRFTANEPNYWGLGYHYSAVLMPIMSLALVDAMSQARASQARGLPRSPRFERFLRLLPSGAVLISVGLAAAFPLNHLVRTDFWKTPTRIATLQRAVDQVPPNSRVAASGHLVPHLVDRNTVYPLAHLNVIECLPRRVDWVVVDTSDFAGPGQPALVAEIRRAGFVAVFDESGVLVLQRQQMLPATGCARA
jgi:uncharacterized membrane protein